MTPLSALSLTLPRLPPFTQSLLLEVNASVLRLALYCPLPPLCTGTLSGHTIIQTHIFYPTISLILSPSSPCCLVFPYSPFLYSPTLPFFSPYYPPLLFLNLLFTLYILTSPFYFSVQLSSSSFLYISQLFPLSYISIPHLPPPPSSHSFSTPTLPSLSATFPFSPLPFLLTALPPSPSQYSPRSLLRNEALPPLGTISSSRDRPNCIRPPADDFVPSAPPPEYQQGARGRACARRPRAQCGCSPRGALDQFPVPLLPSPASRKSLSRALAMTYAEGETGGRVSRDLGGPAAATEESTCDIKPLSFPCYVGTPGPLKPRLSKSNYRGITSNSARQVDVWGRIPY